MKGRRWEVKNGTEGKKNGEVKKGGGVKFKVSTGRY